MNESEYIHLSHNVYHFVSTVGKHDNENVIQEYVKNQGKQDEYKQLSFKMK